VADDVYPPDFTTDIGKVRSLIPDVEQVDFTGEAVPEYIFSDAHITAFLMTADGSGIPRILRAAASGIRAIAVSEGLISKVIKTEDLQTDGAKLASALLGAAKQLDDRADQQEEDDEDMNAFTIVDFQPYPLDCMPYTLRGFPQMCCVGAYTGNCGCGSKDRGAGFGSGVV